MDKVTLHKVMIFVTVVSVGYFGLPVVAYIVDPQGVVVLLYANLPDAWFFMGQYIVICIPLYVAIQYWVVWGCKLVERKLSERKQQKTPPKKVAS